MARPLPGSLCLLAALSVAVTAQAGAPHLVRDINATIIPVDSKPTDFHDQGAWSYFSASDGTRLLAPFATDGTATGTVRLNSINPLPNGTTGYQFARLNGASYFFANDPTTLNATMLWKSDGTAAGTQLVKNVGPDGVNPGIEGVIGNNLILTIFEPGKGREFWRSDGTAAGTVRITDVNGTESADYGNVIVNNRLYFVAGVDSSSSTFEPWVSDGNPNGAHKLGTIADNATNLTGPHIASAGNFIYFTQQTASAGNELWRIDPSNNDAISLVKDIAPGPDSGVTYPEFGSVNGVLLFKANTVAGDPPLLWRSDGTAAGTYQLGNLEAVSNGVTFSGPTSANRALFYVNTPSGAWDAWSTDGTTVTKLPITQPGFIGIVGGLMYLNSAGGQIYRSDGTVAGTKPLSGFPPITGNVEIAGGGSQLFFRVQDNNDLDVYSYDNATEKRTTLSTYTVRQGEVFPGLFGYGQNRLYFDAVDAVTGREIYTSDGTLAGTRLLKNIAPETRTQPSDPQHLFNFNGKLFFSADDGVVGRELWTSDGTVGGTKLVANLNAGADSSNPRDFFVLSNKLYFFATDGPNANSYALWTTDGTAAGTTKITAAIPLSALYGGNEPACGPTAVVIGNYAYLSLYQLGSSTLLWRTDGTAAGTTLMQDMTQPLVDSPCWLTAFQGKVFFSARRFSDVGTELFSASPGASPALVADVYPGSTGSSPEELTVANNRLVFAASTAAGWQAFASDGTAGGTVALNTAGVSFPNSLQSIGSRVLFLGGSLQPYGGVGLYSTDATAANTARVGTVLVNTLLHSNGARVFFGSRVSQPADGLVPWVSDGTAAGTIKIGDSNAADLPSRLWFWDFNGVTMIQAVDAAGSSTLWRSDGTLAGTKLVGDAGIASESAYPNQHQAAGQTFFFVSDKDGSGSELFAIDNDAPVATNDAGGSVQAGAALTIDLLANDTDADGALNAASITVATQPAHGTVTVSAAGVATYTATAGYSGADSFTYTVADAQGARSAAATVSVTVTAPPPPPPPPTGAGSSSGGGGKGGGAFGWLDALLLAGLAIGGARRRRSGQSAQSP